MKNNPAYPALLSLGAYLRKLSDEELQEIGQQAHRHNGWFTPSQVTFTLNQWGQALTAENLSAWLANYPDYSPNPTKRVGIIMAGNIPLVGLHDLICVLLSGHRAYCKFSSQDPYLPHFIIEKLTEFEPALVHHIEVRERLNDIDAVIATGSNNSARYFQQYFGHLPHIIRKNRSSCAVLSGQESRAELQLLGRDIFQYYGLGCRSVSKLLVPAGYSFNPFFEALESFQDITTNHKWVNNYDYHKSIYLVNKEKHLDNGFLLLKPDERISGPVSVIFYQEYSSQEQVSEWAQQHRSELQCVVGSAAPAQIPFGQAQQPRLEDYADGIDTLGFLTNL